MKTLGLTELIARVGGDGAVDIQNLLGSVTQATTGKRGVTKLTFGTRAITASEIASGAPRKMALVVWIDQEKVTAALEAWQRETVP